MRLFLLGVAVVALAACETAVSPVSAQTVSTPIANNAPMANSSMYAPPPDQQLLDLERRLSATAQDHGLGGAYGSVIDPHDGFVMRSGAMYQGAEGVERGLAAPAGAGPIFWQPDRVFVSQGGDMGMTSGRYVQVMTGSEAVQGRYIAVWRKDGAGQWKLLSESRQADPPRAPGPAARVRAPASHPAAAAAHH